MSNAATTETLKDAYALIAELWCGPPRSDVERAAIRSGAEEAREQLEDLDEESAALLGRFLEHEAIAEEDYIDLFELEPQCPLYLGSYRYEEPKTCANAGVSERNDYMIDLVGVYRHFGRVLNGKDLPDYLPLMVDFLSLTSESKEDPIRDKFINEYFLPYLPPMRSRLEELKTPYLYLFDALERVISVEQSPSH